MWGWGWRGGRPFSPPSECKRCQLAQCQGCWLLTEPLLFWPLPMPPVTSGSQRLLPAGWSRGEQKSRRWGESFPAGVRGEPDLRGATGMLRCVEAPQPQGPLAPQRTEVTRGLQRGLGSALDAGGAAVSWESPVDVGGGWSSLVGDVHCIWLWR